MLVFRKIVARPSDSQPDLRGQRSPVPRLAINAVDRQRQQRPDLLAAMFTYASGVGASSGNLRSSINSVAKLRRTHAGRRIGCAAMAIEAADISKSPVEIAMSLPNRDTRTACRGALRSVLKIVHQSRCKVRRDCAGKRRLW
jgi:hypothetical protein